ncbi:MAG: hypothetical protein AMJ79_00935 [Phycisphaerae bacterium SM23_30]|nr:MAG: hypothetical protein AMJ79_00935 [Phycisphaerae bacterium SM23_30]
MDHPLISFVLLSYNHERFIGQAVQGALGQDYHPLEIIISDDASTDRSYEVIQKHLAGYKGGHTIHLRRNLKNSGYIGAHINRIMETARGELIIIAAGDDISLPERTQKIFEAFKDSQGQAMSIYSAMKIIDEQGREIGLHGYPLRGQENDWRVIARNGCRVSGCTHAWHRKVFDVFGPLMKETVFEDRAIPFRSCLLGKIAYIDQPLVLYRRHTQSVTSNVDPDIFDDIKSRSRSNYYNHMVVLQNHARDLQNKAGMLGLNRLEVRSALNHLHRKIRELSFQLQFERGGIINRIRTIYLGLVGGLGLIKVTRWALRMIFPGIYRRWIIHQKKRDYQDRIL